MDRSAIAGRALALLDLTNLDADCGETDIDDLCRKAVGAAGKVAAVCVWPQFVALCRERLIGSGVAIAAVANFPEGSTDIDRAIAETRTIVAANGDEVDVVLPYAAWLAGDHEIAKTLVSRCKDACGDKVHLKVILETGRLKTPGNIIAASRDAIAAGADFIKTSTGKVDVSATPAAAEAMLTVIAETDRPVGFKAAGGIRTLEDAALYLDIADRIMGPDWVSPETFRFGASSLLDDLLKNLADRGT